MAENIGTDGSESFSIVNMKPAGGGSEEINALWGKKVAANTGYLVADTYLSGVMGSLGLAADAAGGDTMQSGTFTLSLPFTGAVISDIIATNVAVTATLIDISLAGEPDNAFLAATMITSLANNLNQQIDSGTAFFYIYHTPHRDLAKIGFQKYYDEDGTHGDICIANINVFTYGG